MTSVFKHSPQLKYKEKDFTISSESEKQIKMKHGQKETKVRVMEGHTVEEMLYTIRAFENKAKDITLPQNRYLEKFVTCMGNKARDKWARMEDSRGTPFQENEWVIAKKEWIKYYVRDGDAKEVILDAWVRTRHYIKPMDVEVSDHDEKN